LQRGIELAGDSGPGLVAGDVAADVGRRPAGRAHDGACRVGCRVRQGDRRVRFLCTSFTAPARPCWHVPSGNITCDFVSRCRPITSRRRAFNAIVIDCPCRPGRRRSPRPAETDAGRPRPVCRGVISSPGRCRLPGRRTAVHRHRVYPGMRAQMRTAGGVARSSVRPGRCAVGHRDQPKGVHQTHESQSLRRVSTPVVP
jgi:hypothetical protein